jgi:segregation and condensation protein B
LAPLDILQAVFTISRILGGISSIPTPLAAGRHVSEEDIMNFQDDVLEDEWSTLMLIEARDEDLDEDEDWDEDDDWDEDEDEDDWEDDDEEDGDWEPLFEEEEEDEDWD